MNIFKADLDLINSKVARRVIGLFLLSALVPLITTAFLSKTYLTTILTDQGYSNLQKEGQFYAMSLFDRLLFLEMRLKHITQNNELQNTPNSSRAKLYGYEFINIKKEKISISKEDSANKIKIDSHASIYSQSGSSGSQHIYMALPLKGSDGQTYQVSAELNPQYLWNINSINNSEVNLCIVNESGNTFYCSESSPGIISYNSTQDSFAGRKISRWSVNDKTYISVSKVLFLKSNFNSENWKVIVTQPEEEVLSPARTFNRIFPLVIILTLLVVLLLSVSQIQRILVPLKRLIKGTRRVASRDFNEKVEVRSDDEFYDLAQSFNTMANRLKKQFAAFTILSEIDRLILSTTETDEIYAIVLKHIRTVIPCDIASITVLEDDDPNHGKTWLSEHYTSFDTSQRILLSERDIRKLKIPTNYNEMLQQAGEQHFLYPLKQFGAYQVCVFPVIVNDTIPAIISLGYLQQEEVSEEDIQQVRNITDRIAVAISAVERDRKLYQQSHYDTLTGLPNRQLISLRLEQEIKHCQREDSTLAILFLDLDHFKRVNDTLGHAIGDALLQEVASRLLSCVRETDTVARLGGDEFTILLTSSLDNHSISTIADNIIHALEKPFTINTHEIFISTSIGISVYPYDGISKNELFKNADTAMYRVKEQGRGKHLFFEEEMNIAEMERSSLERDIRHALERNEFSLHYQPQIDIHNSEVVGAEALIRWNHPVRGRICPEKFIPLAEETGLIEKIGDWVIRSACEQLKIWQDSNVDINRIAVNVSTRQFIQPDFEDHVSDILTATGIEAEKLELEITETLLMDERIDSLQILEKLNRKKIHLSIDDFGTGFSSLSYLKRFPVNTLKIDRSFIKDLHNDEDARVIVKSIIALAHTLNLKVVAEGVQTAEQLALLHDNHCDFAQGFFFSETLTATEFEDYYLKTHNIIKFRH